MANEVFNNSLSGNRKLSDSEYAKPDFFKNDPIAKAVIDKLVSSPIRQAQTSRGFKDIGAPAEQLVRKISASAATNVTDSLAMMQLLPDTKMAMNIMVSSIISPNDMIGNEIHLTVENPRYPSEINAAMMAVVEDYFKKTYKIEQDLRPMLEDILFRKGAYPLLIIPESSIDMIINSPTQIGMEELRPHLTSDGRLASKGILGGNTVKERSKGSNNIFGVSLEAMTLDIEKNPDGVIVELDGQHILTVTDNPDVLKGGMLKQRVLADRADMLVGSGSSKISSKQLEKDIYRRRTFPMIPSMPVPTEEQTGRATVGHPLIINPPMESLIPVHVPGDPTNHVGYFLLLDNTGNPINQSEYLNFFNELTFNTSQNREQVSQLLQATRMQSLGATTTQYSYLDKEAAVQAYTDMVEHDLLLRLKNGIYGDDVAISGSSEVYRIMLARALGKMQTQLLYIPKSLVTYIAFDYNMWGMGKSLLEDTKILGSIRAMLLFANTMAEIKNSVGHEQVNIELDPKDPDPSRTVEFLFHEYAKNRQSRYPVGATNPLDLITYLQNAGVQVAVSGHEAYPVTKLDVNAIQTNRTLVDNDLSDRLKKQQYLGWGIPPEAVDAAAESEFASTIVRNNIMFTKTVTNYQIQFTEFLAEFMRKFTLNSSILMDGLRKAITDNKDTLNAEQAQVGEDRIIADFIASLNVSLPSPDTVKLTTQLDAFKTYQEALEQALDCYFDESFFNRETLGELAEVIESTKAAVKAYFLRQWLNQNNVLPELSDLSNWNDKDGPAINLLGSYDNLLEGLSKTLTPFMEKLLARKQETDATLQNAGAEESDNTESDENTDSGGEDEFGIDEDLTVDETAGSETNDEENPEGGGNPEAETAEGGDNTGDENP